MRKEDIFKVTVSVVMIHVMLLFIYEGFAFTTNNPDDTIVWQQWQSTTGTAGQVENQIASAGLCLEGTATQAECELNGCVWDSGQCFNALEDRTGVDFGFFDVVLSILKIPVFLGKLILFLGSLVFFEILLSFKLMPLITNLAIQFIITITLWVFNITLIYYIWAFISNWRGQNTQ